MKCTRCTDREAVCQRLGESLCDLCRSLELAVAEICCRKAETKIDWVERLRKAHRLLVLPKMLESFAKRLGKVHNREDEGKKPNDKVCSYLMGFADGLLGIDRSHPANNDFEGLNLRMQRDYSPCFSEGFEAGEAIKGTIDAAAKTEQ